MEDEGRDKEAGGGVGKEVQEKYRRSTGEVQDGIPTKIVPDRKKKRNCTTVGKYDIL